jgi:hypothetical protein
MVKKSPRLAARITAGEAKTMNIAGAATHPGRVPATADDLWAA